MHVHHRDLKNKPVYVGDFPVPLLIYGKKVSNFIGCFIGRKSLISLAKIEFIINKHFS